MTFAEKMLQLRQNAALTQKSLADLSGIPLPTIRKVEQGATNKRISLQLAVALAAVLKADLHEFAVCDDVRFAPPDGTKRVKKATPQKSTTARKPRK